MLPQELQFLCGSTIARSSCDTDIKHPNDEPLEDKLTSKEDPQTALDSERNTSGEDRNGSSILALSSSSYHASREQSTIY